MNGILFKPDIIKAILRKEKPKTVTRRLSGLKEINQEPDKWHFVTIAVRTVPPIKSGDCVIEHLDGHQMLVKPRYRVGETVFIREAWATEKKFDCLSPSEIIAGGNVPIWFKLEHNFNISNILKIGRWRSPLHLPEKLARTFLKILKVRAERLQRITFKEAVKEGCGDLGIIPVNTAMILTGTDNLEDAGRKLTVAQFVELWDFIHPQYSYSLKPYVFRYEFALIEKPKENK